MRASRVYRLSTWFMAAALLVNVVGVVYVVKSLRRPLNYSVNLVQPPSPPVFDHVALSPDVAQGSTNIVNLSVNTPPPVPVPRSYPLRYDYFVSEGRTCAFLNGVYYFVGMRHAYGIIVDIFPERIVFSSGDYIENTKTEIIKNEYNRAANTLPS